VRVCGGSGGQDGGGRHSRRRPRRPLQARHASGNAAAPPAAAAAPGGWPAAHQKAPTVRPCLCASSSGMEPYRPKGDSSRYSNTSRLYRRYGSAPARQGRGVRAVCGACGVQHLRGRGGWGCACNGAVPAAPGPQPPSRASLPSATHPRWA
jgi:hypothetical protein